MRSDTTMHPWTQGLPLHTGRTPVSTTPLSPLDQHLLPWDQDEPLCVLCELRVEGQLSRERLLSAIRMAVSRHPMARSRLASSRWNARRRWEIVREVDDIPLTVVDCADEEALDAARSRLLSTRVDLDYAPPFALMLARRTTGDSLCMSLSHVAGDGIGAVRLMRSIACGYAGVDDVIGGPDPFFARELSFNHRGPLSADHLDQLLRVLRLGKEQRAMSTTSRFVTTGGEQRIVSGFRAFSFMRLDTHETKTVLTRRRQPATINDLLIASFAMAVCRWNRAHGLEDGPITVQSALNLRPSEWFAEVVSNLARDTGVVLPESAQNNLSAAQVAIAEQTLEIKEHRTAGNVSVVGPLNLLPRPLRRTAVRVLRRRAHITHAGGVSNLGVVRTFPNLEADAGPVTELWMAPPGIAGVGPLAGALTYNDQLFLTLQYRKAELTREAAQAFGEMWRNILLGSE
jgi:NRPS condensation-like uncharacterized protein